MVNCNYRVFYDYIPSIIVLFFVILFAFVDRVRETGSFDSTTGKAPWQTQFNPVLAGDQQSGAAGNGKILS